MQRLRGERRGTATVNGRLPKKRRQGIDCSTFVSFRKGNVERMSLDVEAVPFRHPFRVTTIPTNTKAVHLRRLTNSRRRKCIPTVSPAPPFVPPLLPPCPPPSQSRHLKFPPTSKFPTDFLLLNSR